MRRLLPYDESVTQMIAPEASIGKRQRAWRLDGSAKCSPKCDILTMRPHGFVNGIIILPNSGQARAKLKRDTKTCCLRARSAIERRIPQPPSPPEFGTDRAQLVPRMLSIPQ